MRKLQTTVVADKVCIYGLVDPRDGIIRYVGRTSAALKNRLNAHKYDLSPCWDGKARGAGQDRLKWMAELRVVGLSPMIKVLEEVSIEGAAAAEKRWVQALFKAGLPLTNRHWRPRTCLDEPDWLRGYATALVELHRLCGHAGAVRSTLERSGLTIEKFKRAGVDEFDLRALARCTTHQHKENNR